MKKFLSLFLLVLLAAIVKAEQPKYVFLFIGDGMGVNEINCTNIYLSQMGGEGRGTKKLGFSDFPVFGVCTTFSANSDVTDSAAAATAIATGTKTNNGMLGVAPDQSRLTSVAEYAKKAGKKVAIATTVGINHATPGGFYGHQKDRGMYYEIGLDLLDSDFDFFGGAGFYNAERAGAENLYSLFEKDGYTIAKGYQDFKDNAKDSRQVILVPENYQNVSMSYAIDRLPGELSLKEITEAAIDVLMRDNKKGFFAMFEGGEIDHGAHGNDLASTIQEIIDFDDAIQVAYQFYLQHPKETLILVTADHDTGAIGLTEGSMGLTRLQYQKQSQNGLTNKIVALQQAKNGKVSWEECKQLLADNMGFWKEITISWEQEKYLRDAYESTLAKNVEIKDRNLYAENTLLAARAKEVMNQRAHVQWATAGHSAGYVPFAAVGVGQEQFSRLLDNTDIPKIIRKVAKY